MKRFGSLAGLAILVVFLLNLAPAARAQEPEPVDVPSADAGKGRHCPDNPAGTYRFFEKSGQSDQDKERLETLSPLAKQQKNICILSLVDPAQLQSRRIAVRRVKWVLDNLVKNGVPRNVISIELRPQVADADAMRLVEVIFGQ